MSTSGPTVAAQELLDQVPVAVTALDRQGNIVFYNQYAASILDRKPEYLGRDIRDFHNPQSNAKIQAILDGYAQGGRQEHTWRLRRGERQFLVRVRPWLRGGEWLGLLHAVMVLE